MERSSLGVPVRVAAHLRRCTLSLCLLHLLPVPVHVSSQPVQRHLRLSRAGMSSECRGSGQRHRLSDDPRDAFPRSGSGAVVAGFGLSQHVEVRRRENQPRSREGDTSAVAHGGAVNEGICFFQVRIRFPDQLQLICLFVVIAVAVPEWRTALSWRAIPDRGYLDPKLKEVSSGQTPHGHSARAR